MDSRGLFTMNTHDVGSSFYEVGHSLLRFNNHLCTSNGRSVTGRNASTTSGPIVMLGTKRPSITSTCIQSQPATSTALTYNRRFDDKRAISEYMV
ncbi:hypothetical protein Hanom_Chr02g00127521 [Helianthus anomalus]